MIRKSPRRWCFWFWIVAVPLIVLAGVAEPLIIEPLFFKFTPLEQTQPQLAARIEFVKLEPGRAYDISGVRVTPHLQLHSGDSYGYRFEHGGKSVVYSTDSEHKRGNRAEAEGFARFFRDAAERERERAAVARRPWIGQPQLAQTKRDDLRPLAESGLFDVPFDRLEGIP